MGAQDGEELQRAIQLKVPAKIDIGPVYNVDPQRRAAFQGAPALLPGLQPVGSVGSGSECARLECAGLGAERGFQPVERELVFDIDLTDYDDVRTCGREGHICAACWPLMAVAVQARLLLRMGLQLCATPALMPPHPAVLAMPGSHKVKVDRVECLCSHRQRCALT